MYIGRYLLSAPGLQQTSCTWEAVSRAPSVERRVSAAPVSRAPQLITTNNLG